MLNKAMVLIDPGNNVEQTEKGIFIPEKSQVPFNFGTVIEAGPGEERYASTVRPGDIVCYEMDDTGAIDGLSKFCISIDGRLALLMDEAFVQGRIKNEEKMKSISSMLKSNKRKSFYLDYEQDVEMCGYKIAVELLKEATVTASGITIPETSMHKQSTRARVLSISPNARGILHNPDELRVGDHILVSKAPSGGILPMSGDKSIWRLNIQEVIARFDEELEFWKPVGGRVLLKPIYPGIKKTTATVPHPTIHGATQQQEAYLDLDSNLYIPITKRLQVYQGEVMSVGDGWGQSHSTAKIEGTLGRPPFEKGDILLHMRFVSADGDLSRYVESITVNDVEYFLVDIRIIDGKIKADKVDIFRETYLDPPDGIHEIE
jgi:co-chaperonin GroES (HSP10)